MNSFENKLEHNIEYATSFWMDVCIGTEWERGYDQRRLKIHALTFIKIISEVKQKLLSVEK